MNREENELLTKVEGDAPMGVWMRENFWVPAYRSKGLEADGAPARVRLFGKNYVAFRATDGRVGFLNERCPHRGVSLALARNEDCALRCLFHGWKISVTGELLETPNHPDPEFRHKAPVKSYPVVDAGGLIWVWLGDNAPAKFPEYEFTKLPPEQCIILATTQNFNWLQGVEVTLDSSHLAMLHAGWLKGLGDTSMTSDNNAPRYEFETTPYGYRAAALRDLSDGRCYSRVTEFVLPWAGFIPPNREDGNRLTIFSVPVDDEHSRHYYVRFNILRPVDPAIYMPFPNLDEFAPLPGGPETSWGQDRKAMKEGNHTGFHTLFEEDFAVQESMGAITDRTNEFLCDGDLAVIRARRMLLNGVRAYMESKKPGHEDGISYPSIRSYSKLLPIGQDWRAA